MASVLWTDYMRYRAQIRGYELSAIEAILLYSEERYFDSTTQRMVAVGGHGKRLVVIPYERQGEVLTPVTVHATTRQQVNLRLRTGRFKP